MEETSLDKFRKIKKPLKEYRQQFESNMRQEEKVYYGDLWKDGEYKPFENTVFQIIEAEVPTLTDSLTNVVVRTNDPEKQSQAKVMSKSLEWVQRDQNMMALKEVLALKCLITGSSFLFIDYCPLANNGQGAITYEVLSWRDVLLDGNVGFIEKSEKGVVCLRKNRHYLAKRYPSKKKEILNAKSSIKNDQIDDYTPEKYDPGNGIGGQHKRKIPTRYTDEDLLKWERSFFKDYTTRASTEEETTEELEKEAVALDDLMSPDVELDQDHQSHIETHIAELANLLSGIGLPPDTTREELFEWQERQEDISSQTGMDVSSIKPQIIKISLLMDHIEAHGELLELNPSGERPKYRDNWRQIDVIEDVVVYDGDLKLEYSGIPMAVFYCYHDGTIYGFGQVRNLMDSQKMSAIMKYKEYKGGQRMWNPAWNVSSDTGLKRADIKMDDGAIFITRDGTGVNPIQPGQVSEQMVRFSGERLDQMNKISGMNEVTQGENITGSGYKVNKIQQMAIGRIRRKQRRFDLYSMKRVAEITVALIASEWTNEKIISIDDNEGELEQIVYSPVEMKDIEFDFIPSPGSMAGVDKDQLNAVIMKFVELGQMPLDIALRFIELPRSSEMLEAIRTDSELKQRLEQLAIQNQELANQVDILTNQKGV